MHLLGTSVAHLSKRDVWIFKIYLKKKNKAFKKIFCEWFKFQSVTRIIVSEVVQTTYPSLFYYTESSPEFLLLSSMEEKKSIHGLVLHGGV